MFHGLEVCAEVVPSPEKINPSAHNIKHSLQETLHSNCVCTYKHWGRYGEGPGRGGREGGERSGDNWPVDLSG